MAFFNTHFATSFLVFLITLSISTAHNTPAPTPVPTSYTSSSPKGSIRALAPVPTSYVSSSPKGSPRASAPLPASYISSSPKGSPRAPAPLPASYVSSSLKGSPSPAPGRSYSIVLPSATSSNYLPFDALQDGLVSIPMDEQAKDRQFLEAHMAKAANEIEQFMINVVEKQLKDPETEQSTKECLDICGEVYDHAVESLRKGMEDINGLDFSKAASDVAAFKNNLNTCDDCLGDMVDSEFNKMDNWARGVGNDCLEKITKYTPNPTSH